MRIAILWLLVMIVGLVWGVAEVAGQDAVPTPTTIPDPSAMPVYVPFTPEPYVMQDNQRLIDVAFGLNICPEDIIQANRDVIPDEAILEKGSGSFFKPDVNIGLPATLNIPPHEPCYTIVAVSDPHFLPQIEVDYNVCFEEFVYLARQIRQGAVITAQTITYHVAYLRKDAPPCVNDEGQRLKYFDHDVQWLDVPVYNTLPFTDTYDRKAVCIGDLALANPHISLGTETAPLANVVYSHYEGLRLFLSPETRPCEIFKFQNETLYEISQMMNVCMEDILSASGQYLKRFEYQTAYLYIPQDGPPCYNPDGSRIGFTDRAVYKPQVGESFLDIAQKHDVCFDDLWAANPVMDEWTGWIYQIPEALFIPDTAPCADDWTITAHAARTVHTLTLLTNVCGNQIVAANPALASITPLYDFSDWQKSFGRDMTLVVPQRPACYALASSPPMNSPDLIPYVCYPVPVTGAADFTSHEPPVTASGNTDLPYCYERVEGMTIIYDNQPYTLYRMRGYESYTLLSQCFGISRDAFLSINPVDDPWQAQPTTTAFWGGLLIPQPHEDCGLNTPDDAEHHRYFTELTYKAGYLIDGVYHINYQDTLSSIGRTYGYLPSMIAAANDLPDDNMIYYLQELRMPPYPSFYVLVPVGGVFGGLVLAGMGFYGVSAWRRRRGKSKKKNDGA